MERLMNKNADKNLRERGKTIRSNTKVTEVPGRGRRVRTAIFENVMLRISQTDKSLQTTDSRRTSHHKQDKHTKAQVKTDRTKTWKDNF